MDELSEEDPDWEEGFETRMDARCVELEAYRLLNEVSSLRKTGLVATSLLEDRLGEGGDPEERRALYGLHHNAAAPIYRAGQ